MFQLLQSVLKATQVLLICKGSRFQLQGLWPLNAAFLGPVSGPLGGQLDGEPAQGTLSVTAGDYTSHSNSFAHRAEAQKGRTFVGLSQGIWWGYGSFTTTSWSPGYYQSALPSFWGEG